MAPLCDPNPLPASHKPVSDSPRCGNPDQSLTLPSPVPQTPQQENHFIPSRPHREETLFRDKVISPGRAGSPKGRHLADLVLTNSRDRAPPRLAVSLRDAWASCGHGAGSHHAAPWLPWQQAVARRFSRAATRQAPGATPRVREEGAAGPWGHGSLPLTRPRLSTARRPAAPALETGSRICSPVHRAVGGRLAKRPCNSERLGWHWTPSATGGRSP